MKELFETLHLGHVIEIYRVDNPDMFTIGIVTDKCSDNTYVEFKVFQTNNPEFGVMANSYRVYTSEDYLVKKGLINVSFVLTQNGVLGLDIIFDANKTPDISKWPKELAAIALARYGFQLGGKIKDTLKEVRTSFVKRCQTEKKKSIFPEMVKEQKLTASKKRRLRTLYQGIDPTTIYEHNKNHPDPRMRLGGFMGGWSGQNYVLDTQVLRNAHPDRISVMTPGEIQSMVRDKRKPAILIAVILCQVHPGDIDNSFDEMSRLDKVSTDIYPEIPGFVRLGGEHFQTNGNTLIAGGDIGRAVDIRRALVYIREGTHLGHLSRGLSELRKKKAVNTGPVIVIPTGYGRRRDFDLGDPNHTVLHELILETEEEEDNL
jgi:hypothetical protein